MSSSEDGEDGGYRSAQETRRGLLCVLLCLAGLSKRVSRVLGWGGQCSSSCWCVEVPFLHDLYLQTTFGNTEVVEKRERLVESTEIERRDRVERNYEFISGELRQKSKDLLANTRCGVGLRTECWQEGVLVQMIIIGVLFCQQQWSRFVYEQEYQVRMWSTTNLS